MGTGPSSPIGWDFFGQALWWRFIFSSWFSKIRGERDETQIRVGNNREPIGTSRNASELRSKVHENLWGFVEAGVHHRHKQICRLSSTVCLPGSNLMDDKLLSFAADDVCRFPRTSFVATSCCVMFPWSTPRWWRPLRLLTKHPQPSIQVSTLEGGEIAWMVWNSCAEVLRRVSRIWEQWNRVGHDGARGAGWGRISHAFPCRRAARLWWVDVDGLSDG